MIGPIGNPEGKALGYRDIRKKFHTREHPVSMPSLSRHWNKCVKPALAGPAGEEVTTRAEMMIVESFQGYLKRHELILARLIDSMDAALMDPSVPGRYVMLGTGKRKAFDYALKLLDRSQKHIELVARLEGRFTQPEETSGAPTITLAYIRLILQAASGNDDVIDLAKIVPGSLLEQ